MTRTALTILTVISITVAPALVGAGMDAAANPDFGNPQFMWHLQQDVGMIDSGASPKRPCPTVRGVPVPPTWGYKWRPENEWMRYIDRHGYPPDREHAAGRETPDQKWHKTVKRYRAFLVNHPYTGWSGWHVKHDHFVQYLEQNWYNYWHRLRYGSNPPNHDSHYHGWGYGREGW